jgi:acetolactate synthase-1/2/3 large subunit
VEVGVLGDLRQSLEQLAQGVTPFSESWTQACRMTVADGFEAELKEAPSWPVRPQHVVRDIRVGLRPDDVVICDVGAHKLWMSRMFACEAANSCIVSNGFAAMGLALPGAIAAKLLYPERRVLAVTGDGGFLMNSQELETAVRLALPIVVLVWRDNGYGVIRWKQMLRYGRTSSVEFGNPDLVRYAESFGAIGYRVTEPAQLPVLLTEAFTRTVPVVIDCPVDYGENLRLTERLQGLPHGI